MSNEVLSTGLVSSLALVALMGFRHGFDADHIAVVDGMTRARQLHRSYWTSRRVGLQFAVGHSATILVAALLLFDCSASLPAWLGGVGLFVSTGFLLVVAASNLSHALGPANPKARPLGPVSTTLFRLTGHHLHPALVGMAFAISFDSMAQAAFFAARGSDFSGVHAVALMALVFGVGMTLADATNGALLNWFADRSDHLGRHASRMSSGFIALIALATAVAGVVRASHDSMTQAWEQTGVWAGAGLVVSTTLVFALRLALQRTRLARAAPAS